MRMAAVDSEREYRPKICWKRVTSAVHRGECWILIRFEFLVVCVQVVQRRGEFPGENWSGSIKKKQIKSVFHFPPAKVKAEALLAHSTADSERLKAEYLKLLSVFSQEEGGWEPYRSELPWIYSNACVKREKLPESALRDSLLGRPRKKKSEKISCG